MNSSDETDLKVQKQEYEKQPLIEEFIALAKEWERTYCRLMRELVDAFGEEEVLDIVERTWWDQAFEVGKTWREEFERDPQAALEKKAHSWHDDAVWARICCCDVPVLETNRWELVAVKCYRELFREMGEPKLGISWCMTDFAAVRGWSPKIVMDQPNNMLRGDNYCHQIREIVEQANPALDEWSIEKSEKYGWRSIKKLEEG
jgi:hypothetical protein